MTIPMTIIISLSEYLAMGHTIDSLREQVEKLEKQLAPKITKAIREDPEYGLREIRHTLRFGGIEVHHVDCHPKEHRADDTTEQFKRREAYTEEKLAHRLGLELLKRAERTCKSTIDEVPIGLDFFEAPTV